MSADLCRPKSADLRQHFVRHFDYFEHAAVDAVDKAVQQKVAVDLAAVVALGDC